MECSCSESLAFIKCSMNFNRQRYWRVRFGWDRKEAIIISLIAKYLIIAVTLQPLIWSISSPTSRASFFNGSWRLWQVYRRKENFVFLLSQVLIDEEKQAQRISLSHPNWTYQESCQIITSPIDFHCLSWNSALIKTIVE